MEKPKLVMVIEPESIFRFRYDSETNSHGGVKGKSGGKKTHPTVKLLNYNGHKKVRIRVSLYTLKHEKHVLEIKGKNAENGMSYEDLDDNFTATFTSLSIMRKKKEEIIRILMNRKIESMGPIRGAAARGQLEKAHETEIKEKAKEIMNSAILCFEAFIKDSSTQPICSPLFSGPIFSQKPLKIHHLSHYSGSWRGGDTIILLCDKVEKGKVRVQFYEDDESYQWGENAKFSAADVHYQVAIKFKTPPFRGNIEKEVNVCLIQDGEKSIPVQFLYTSDKKDLVSSSKKRKWNTIGLESENLSTHQSSFLENTPSPSSSSNDYSSDNHMEQKPPLDNINYSHMPQCNSVNTNATAVNIEENQSLYSASLEEVPVSIHDINAMDMQSGTGFTDLLKFFEDELSEDLANERENPENSISMAFSMLGEPVPEYVPDGPTKSHLGKSFTHEMLHAEMFVEQCMSNLTLNGRGETVSVTSPGLKCMKHNRISNNLKDKGIYFKLMCMRDESDNSLLHKAVLQNKGVRKLLEMSKIIDYDIVNVRNCNKKSSMHIATEKNDFGILGLLLKYGGNSNLKDENGNGCLHIAAENGFVNCLKEIFSHGCHPHVNAFNYQGLTPLHISVMKGSCACVELLLKYADVNEKDKKSGRSPLHFAVDMQPFLLPTLLRKCNVSVNVQDFGGNTPLHLASVSAHVDCVKQLLEAGADPWIRNFKNDYHISDQNSDDETTDGETAMDVAENLEIIELLQKAIEKTRSSVQSDSLDDTFLLLDPVAEEKLCCLLDPEKYRSLAECIGMDICLISQLIKLNPSPTRQILKYLKMQYEDQYIDVLKNSLEIAGLDEALKIIKERQH